MPTLLTLFVLLVLIGIPRTIYRYKIFNYMKDNYLERYEKFTRGRAIWRKPDNYIEIFTSRLCLDDNLTKMVRIYRVILLGNLFVGFLVLVYFFEYLMKSSW